MKYESANDNKSGELAEFQRNQEMGVWSKIWNLVVTFGPSCLNSGCDFLILLAQNIYAIAACNVLCWIGQYILKAVFIKEKEKKKWNHLIPAV